ncbi:MAG: hypothetical protein NUV31_10740 [Dehalococcoidales bacterium]|jgi:hypothetical protein|nr:hypothetical protein [Dehalococcoidales bacterium]
MAIKWTEEDVIKAFQEAMQPSTKPIAVNRDLILKKLLNQAKQNKKQE